jgi:hypothetical protein
MLSKFIKFIKSHEQDIVLLVGVVLISLLSFAIGFITAKQQEKQPLQFEMTEEAEIINNKKGANF